MYLTLFPFCQVVSFRITHVPSLLKASTLKAFWFGFGAFFLKHVVCSFCLLRAYVSTIHVASTFKSPLIDNIRYRRSPVARAESFQSDLVWESAFCVHSQLGYRLRFSKGTPARRISTDNKNSRSLRRSINLSSIARLPFLRSCNRNTIPCIPASPPVTVILHLNQPRQIIITRITAIYGSLSSKYISVSLKTLPLRGLSHMYDNFVTGTTRHMQFVTIVA